MSMWLEDFLFPKFIWMPSMEEQCPIADSPVKHSAIQNNYYDLTRETCLIEGSTVGSLTIWSSWSSMGS